MITKKSVLLLVDLQNDFCPGGALPVPEGDQVMSLANQLQHYFSCVIASKDWHPSGHSSFASSHPNNKIGDLILLNNVPQILWPDHCLQNTTGADFHPALNISRIQHIIFKGIDPDRDSYSAFFDNARARDTGLNAYLKKNHITDIYILGLATDYCVKFTCLDAISLGYTVYLILDACRGVNLQVDDSKKAVAEMEKAGAQLVTADQIALTIQADD